MSDLISRQAAIDAAEKLIKDCNPDHFVGHQKFIEFMDNAEIGSFGNWQFANGFNLGLTAAEVAIKNLPSAQPDLPIKAKCAFCPHCNNCDVNDDLSIQPCVDTISRQAAIDSIEKHLRLGDELYPLTDTDKVMNHAFAIAASCVYNLPSAQRTGRWIYNDEAYPGGNPYGHYECDQCGEYVPHKTNYCPNCGADMRGEQDG